MLSQVMLVSGHAVIKQQPQGKGTNILVVGFLVEAAETACSSSSKNLYYRPLLKEKFYKAAYVTDLKFKGCNSIVGQMLSLQQIGWLLTCKKYCENK